MHAIPAPATTASQRFREAIQLYSGEWIQLPIKTDVWKTWRNMRIREEMEKVDKTDSIAIKAKKELAKFWNISFSRVVSIYREESERFSAEYEEVNIIAQSIYREENERIIGKKDRT